MPADSRIFGLAVPHRFLISDCKYAINAERLDAEVMEAVRRIAPDENFIRDQYQEWQREQAEQAQRNQTEIEQSAALVTEAQQDVDKIDKLFLTGVVTPTNADLWNEKLQSARDRLELVQQKHRQLVDELAGIKSNADLPDLLKEMRRWVDLLDRADDDFTMKRNLILLVVKNVRCIDREGYIEIAVMTKGKKWRGILLSNPLCLKPGFSLEKLRIFGSSTVSDRK